MSMVIKIRSKIFVVIVGMFIITSIIVVSNIIRDIDDSIVRGVTRGNTILDAIMLAFSFTADIHPFYFSPLIIISFILFIRHKSRKVGAILLVTLVIAVFITLQLKSLLYIERPDYSQYLNFKIDDDDTNIFTGSYPSGHAARSTIFAYIIQYVLPKRRLSMLIWSLPIGVSISRVYVGVHYPTDVIGGILLGLIIASIFTKLLKIDKPLLTK